MSIVHSSGSSDGVRGGKKTGYLRSPLVAIFLHFMSIALEDIGGVPGIHDPSSSIVFHFMKFSGQNDQNSRFAPLPLGWRSILGSLGSATAWFMETTSIYPKVARRALTQQIYELLFFALSLK